MTSVIKLFIAVFVISFEVSFVSCAKILAVFPTPSISHQIVFRPLTHELVRRGHEVTVVTTDPAFSKENAPLNLTEIDVHDLSYKIWRTFLNEKSGSRDDIYSQFGVIMKLMSRIFEAQLATKEFQNVLKNGKFDLLVLEAYFRPALILSHIFKAPVIQFSSFGGWKYHFDVFGASTHPLLYPTPTHQKLYNLTNIEKLQQLYNRWRMENIFDQVEQENNELIQNIFGQDIPPIRELFNNVQLLFLNIHSIWTDNQPVPPSVVYVGGIHKNPIKPLPKDLDSVLNKSKNGVIYFSLGTNLKSSQLPPEKIQMIIKVFSQLQHDVIWKWDQDSLPGITENIKIYKWLPQPDLLKHPKVKLFITQGGLQSTDEAIDAAVPLIGIPMSTDQWYNTEKYKYHKIGITLDILSLTEEVFKDAIETVISNRIYKENIKRLRTLFEDELETPLERAVWWTEYVLRHGSAQHLKAAGANKSWAQYIELELVSIVVLLLFLALILVWLTLCKVWRLVTLYLKRNIKTKTS